MQNTNQSNSLTPFWALLNSLGLAPHFHGNVTLLGKDPILASPHKVGEAVSIALLLGAAAASVIAQYRTHRENDLTIDIHDAIHYLHPVHFVWQSGYNMDLGADKVPINFSYQTKTGQFVWLQCGPPYPKLQDGYLNFFNCGNNREEIAKVVAQWEAGALEDKLTELGLPCCIVRTKDQWRDHPQGKILSSSPVIEIEKIAEGPPYGLQKNTGKFPLEGTNVLDMTHVLAGPRSAMSLAEFGANVLYICSPRHADPKTINLGVNHGKKSAFLDLEDKNDLSIFHQLLRQADVFTFSYRPGVARRHQITPTDVVSSNPNGIVYLSINAYGHAGPWQDRPGFDQNAQMVTGFAATEGSLIAPKPSPVYYINDLLSAYFAAAGVMAALFRRATEGGSYHVKVSLARSCMWAQDLGLVSVADYQAMPTKDRYPARFSEKPEDYTYLPKFMKEPSAYGELIRLQPAVNFTNLALRTDLTVVPFGASKPEF